MKTLEHVIAVCLTIPLLFGILCAQTHVSGTVSGVWSAAGNPYIADSSLYVPRDSTLILMPGVDLQFYILASLTVDGEIQAQGLPGDSVTFRTLAGAVPLP